VLRGMIQLRHTGTFMGQGPTGNQIQFASISIRRIGDGTIAEEWQVNDRFAFLQQLGVIPAPKS
jgi:predicted ester cyclase